MKKDLRYRFSKIKRLFFLAIILILLSTIIVINYFYNNNRYLKNVVLDEQKVEIIKNSRSIYKDDIDLYYNNEIIPYAKENDFYLFHYDKKEDYKKIYAPLDFKIGFIKFENENRINLLVYNDKYYKEVNIEITNLPVVYISQNNDLLVYESSNLIHNYNCLYEQRGNSSAISNKKSYKLDIYNKKNKKTDVSFLGMNKNESWILNPIYFDNSYVREKLSYDIWNNISNQYNHQLEYVEFIMNGSYEGIYYLTEPVTVSTFNGNIEKDLLITINKHFDSNIDSLNISNFIDLFEIENDVKDDYKKKTAILESFNYLIYNKKEKESIEIKYDLENSANYSLFLMLTIAKDNSDKNQKILFRDMGDYYLLQKTVWDLDWTFNNENISKELVDPSKNVIDVDLSLNSEFRKDKLFKTTLQEKYFIARKDFYNIENLEKIIDNYNNYLISGGAISREENRWNNFHYLESIEIVKESIKRRIEYLDEYFGGA